MNGRGEWSAPDADGVRTRLRWRPGGRRERSRRSDTVGEIDWPSEWRELAIAWLRGGRGTRRWDALAAQAGNARMGMALALRDALVAGGWAECKERWEPGRDWRPVELRWLHPETLARRLGLPDSSAQRVLADRLREAGFSDPRLPALADSLTGPAATVLRRTELLRRLDAWLREGRLGTRRQFALFARGSSKLVSESEWAWLDETLGLEAIGISAHTPGFWLRAPLSLRLPAGRLDLVAAVPALALPPRALIGAAIEGRVQRWRIVENRTSFEQAACAHGGMDGVVWVPGFAPPWWRETMASLLASVPAPALIACDPDPAGIRIALLASAVWDGAGMGWSPWRMDATDLRALPARRDLSSYDRAELARLRTLSLPDPLRRLADALDEDGCKGEQEGLDLGV